MTDGNTLNGGFYVDDIRPICLFGNVNTISNSITDTAYTFTNHANGEFYYYVRGYNTRGWGEYSTLAKANVGVGISEEEGQKTSEGFALSVNPNPFRNHLVIKFQIPEQGVASVKIYGTSGRLVKLFNHLTNFSFNHVVWDGTDDSGRKLPSGVYFVRLETDGFKKNEKVILLR
jgi:hypothetical protein